MTKDLTPQERRRMTTIQNNLQAITTVQKLHHDSNTGAVLNAVSDELRKEYDALTTRAREAARERMRKASKDGGA